MNEQPVGAFCPHCSWAYTGSTYEQTEKAMNEHTRELCNRQKLTNIETKVDRLIKLVQDILAAQRREAELQKLRSL